MNVDQLIALLDEAKQRGIVKGTDKIVIVENMEDCGIVHSKGELHFTDSVELYDREGSYRILWKQ